MRQATREIGSVQLNRNRPNQAGCGQPDRVERGVNRQIDAEPSWRANHAGCKQMEQRRIVFVVRPQVGGRADAFAEDLADEVIVRGASISCNGFVQAAEPCGNQAHTIAAASATPMAEQTVSAMRDKRGTAESQGKGEVSFVVLLDILSVVLAVVSSVVLLAATALSASSTASSAAVGIVLSVLCCFIAIHRSRSRESKPQIAIAPAFCNPKRTVRQQKLERHLKTDGTCAGMGARRTRNAGRIGGRRAETSASRNKIAAYPTFDFQEVFRLHTEV